MNKKAATITTVLIFMIVVVVTSAIVLSLVTFGVLEPNPEYEDVEVLNTQFVPLERSGSIAVNDVKLCQSVSSTLECLGQSSSFEPGQVHFILELESSVYAGDIILAYNYRIRGPDGDVILEIDEQDTFYFQDTSSNKIEDVTYTDFIILQNRAPKGEYALEFVIENPLLAKKATIVERFVLE